MRMRYFLMLMGCSVVAAAQSAAASSTGDFAACFEQQSAVVPFNGIVIATNGATTFERASGFSDGSAKSAFTRDSSVRLASVQKVLTRIAIGQLVDAGKIDLDAPASRYLSSLPPTMAAVTVEHLLQHRSGTVPLMRITPKEGAVLRTAASAMDLLPLVTSEPLRFEPGSKEEYSNGGYFLLGAIIEAVSGKTYGNYLADAIFRPLGMINSGLEPTLQTAVRMTRLPPMPGQPMLAAAQPMTGGPQFNGTPAGDGVSSASDLVKLGQALIGDRLLSPSVKARIFPRRGDHWRIGQAGGSIGVNTDFAAYPEGGWVVVTASNYDPPSGELMGQVLRNLALGKGCTPISAKDRPAPFQQAPGHRPLPTS